MGKAPLGYRFSPTGEELIIYYLMNKIKDKTWLVEEAIGEINICSYEPKFLPSLARIKSDDLVWYFFCPREYISENNKVTKRSTGSGFWKPTGKDRKIKDKRGKGVEIGLKKTLVYHEGKVPNGLRTPWVIHEYHITCLPRNQRTYVICQVMYKGEDGDILYGINSNEPSHSLASVPNTSRAFNTEPEGICYDPSVSLLVVSFVYSFRLNNQVKKISLVSLDDLVIPPVNVPNGLSLSDGFNPNTLLSDNNINPNVQPQTPCDEPYFKQDAFNTALDQLQVEQRGEENIFVISLDDLEIPPVNVQNGLSLSDGFNPNTLFSDNNINPNVQPQTPCDEPYFNQDAFNTALDQLEVEENFNCSSANDLLMPMNQHNDLAGFDPNTFFLDFSANFVDCSSDRGSYCGSICAMIYKGTSSSPASNVASPIPSCSSTDSCKDLQTSPDPSITRKTKDSQLTSKQEVKQGTPRAVDASIYNESSLLKTEKKGLFILEDAKERNRKNPRYIDFINMIIGFILFLALIGNTISVLLPFKKLNPSDGV